MIAGGTDLKALLGNYPSPSLHKASLLLKVSFSYWQKYSSHHAPNSTDHNKLWVTCARSGSCRYGLDRRVEREQADDAVFGFPQKLFSPFRDERDVSGVGLLAPPRLINGLCFRVVEGGADHHFRFSHNQAGQEGSDSRVLRGATESTEARQRGGC